MEKSSKNEKSLWIKSRKMPGPKKKGKIGFSEDRKQQRLLVRPRNSSTLKVLSKVITKNWSSGLQFNPLLLDQVHRGRLPCKSPAAVTLQASCENIKYHILHLLGRFLSSAAR